ncbi:MAG TPA: PadR family transcriptional regulator [Burkholderiales bacterium]|nr:PadR family transcriptional regulator [Burkholderiales bacterium]
MFDRHDFRYWGLGRMFQKGDFKYLILDLLRDKPRYGYEIIRELEERFHGFYSPSPGTVYPTLQYLEDMGYVTSKEQDGKRIYTVTVEGLKFLDEESKTVDDVWERMKHGWGHWNSELRDQFRDMMAEFAELGRLIGRRARGMNRDKMRRIGEVLKRAYAEIEKIILEEPPPAV